MSETTRTTPEKPRIRIVMPRAARWMWGACTFAFLASSLIPGSEVPPAALLGWDKLAHAVAFAALGALSLAAFRGIRRRYELSVAHGAFVGVATELLQGLAPARTVSFWDWTADVVGTALVVAAVAAVVLWKARRKADRGRVTSQDEVARCLAE